MENQRTMRTARTVVRVASLLVSGLLAEVVAAKPRPQLPAEGWAA